MSFPRLLNLAPALSSGAKGYEQTQITKISLERTTCYGTCPATKSRRTLTASLSTEGKDFVKIKGKRTAAISVKTFGALRRVEDIHFFRLDNEYSSRTTSVGPVKLKENSSQMIATSSFTTVTDQPTYITTVTKGTLTKKVENYYGGPKALNELEQLIDELTNSAQWTGRTDENKDIPYYDSFPLNRRLTVRGLLETARSQDRKTGKWVSHFILMLVKNPESFDIVAESSINLRNLDLHIVDATRNITLGPNEQYVFHVNRMRGIRRYAESQ